MTYSRAELNNVATLNEVDTVFNTVPTLINISTPTTTKRTNIYTNHNLTIPPYRFRHPLTVSDMSTFASPHNYGSYGYGYMSGAGTPERYSDLANRYAYRTKSYEPEVEEVASELNSEPVAVARRSLSDSYYTRKCKFYKKSM